MPEVLKNYDQNGQSLYYSEAKTEFFSVKDKYFDGRNFAKTRPLILGSVSDLRVRKLHDKELNLNPLALSLARRIKAVEPRSSIDPDVFVLENYIRTSFGPNKIPLYVFDDHNHALFAWFEALEEGRILPGSTLYHFDEHTDGARSNVTFKKNWNLESMAQLAKEVADNRFIHPAMALRLITRVNWYHFQGQGRKENPDIKLKSIDLYREKFPEKLDGSPEKSILDIDIDFFCRCGYLRKPDEIEILRFKRLMHQAGVITIALSPEYVFNIPLALDITKELISDSQVELPLTETAPEKHPDLLTRIRNLIAH